MTYETRKQTSFAGGNDQVDSIEQYTFEPIKGYPMLQWHGKRPFTSTQYYPAQHKETYGPEVNGWRNKIYWGDNLQVMSHLLKEYRGKVELVYIDPPFDSGADYKRKISLRGQRVNNDHGLFEEKQYSDIWTNDGYLQFIYDRAALIRELLTDTGTIYLHCDNHRVHLIRCILDEIFGPDNFLSQIVWKRTNSHNSADRYGPVHDSILHYAKGAKIIWNKPQMDIDPEFQEKRYSKVDKDGRKYSLQELTAPGTRNGETGLPWKGFDPNIFGRHWRWPVTELDRVYQEGRIYLPESGGWPRLKVYLENASNTKPASDWWEDIAPLFMSSSERLDYPTQKPEALLKRIIEASSKVDDIVFDCFMGSGTTQAAAMKLGRRFIGADINLGAVQISTKRLLAVGAEIQQPQRKLNLNDNDEDPPSLYTGFEIYNVNNYDIFRNPVEAKDLMLQALEVSQLQAGSLFDGEKDGRMVKLMPVNRIATRQDLNELITGFDYRAFDRRQVANPNQPVEKITLVCMGHEPGLGAHLQREVNYKLDVEVVDILRDKQDIQFKRDSEAKIAIKGGKLVIERFYPMNLLSKLSLQQEKVEDWRELVESVMIDWNYDGAVLQPALIDIPEGNELVAGSYAIPADAGTIRVKITDLLSESLEQEVRHG